MENPIYIPTLSHWEYGNVWSGEHGRARFYITPKDGQMTVEMWVGPLCRELSQILSTQVFPISEEGLEAMRAWLLSESEALSAQAEAEEKK